MVEQRIRNAWVAGSSPAIGFFLLYPAVRANLHWESRLIALQYQEFLETIKALVSVSVPEGTTVTLTQVLKNNDTKRDALCFQKKEEDVSPTIYLEPFYRKYLGGEDPEELAGEVILMWEASVPEQSIDLTFFSDYEKVKKRLVYKLISQKSNPALLAETPYIPWLDLAIVFYCLLSEAPEGNATILIKEKHLASWGVTKEALFEEAKRNTPFLLSPVVKDLKDMLPPGLLNIPPESAHVPPLYVLTNRLKMNGAACLLYDDLLKDFSEKHASDFYILPSSVHEVLLLPAEGRKEDESLSAMVREVNRTQLSAEEFLSDHVYYYSRKEHALCV